jgi:hypothetical protein
MTENTALLIGTRSRLSLPPLDPTVRCVRILSETTQLALSDLCPHELATHTDATRTAYALLVLLRLRTTGVQKRGVSQDVWEDWSSEQRNSRNAQHIESLILSLWTQFLSDYRSPQDIEDVLWLEFPIDEGNHSFFRGR